MEGCRIEREIGRPREGAKWLKRKRSAEHATARSPRALREPILLHKKGLNGAVFADHEYLQDCRVGLWSMVTPQVHTN